MQMNTIRVDGNDAFAVYEVTKAARKLTLETQKPVSITTAIYPLYSEAEVHWFNWL